MKVASLLLALISLPLSILSLEETSDRVFYAAAAASASGNNVDGIESNTIRELTPKKIPPGHAVSNVENSKLPVGKPSRKFFC